MDEAHELHEPLRNDTDDLPSDGDGSSDMNSDTDASFSAPKTLRKMVDIGLPVFLNGCLRSAVPTLSVAMVGQLEGEDELAAIGLANVFCNVTGYSLLWGMGSAIDTLASQAFGAKNLHKVGVGLQRAFLILMFTTVLPMSFLWLFADKVLIALNQPPAVCRLVQRYAVVRIPGLVLQCVQVVLQKSMYAMQVRAFFKSAVMRCNLFKFHYYV